MDTQFTNYFFSQSMHQVFNRMVKRQQDYSAQAKVYLRLALKTANQN